MKLFATFIMVTGWTTIWAESPQFMQVKTIYNTLSIDKHIMLLSHDKGGANIFWGLTLPQIEPLKCHEGNGCLDFSVAKLVVTESDHCHRIQWTTTQLSQLKDCIALEGHWYGGGEQINQPWPIEKVSRPETPFVTADMLQNRNQWYGGVSEAYWISSQGIALRVEEETPLFLSLPDEDNDGKADYLCMRASHDLPFSEDTSIPLSLSYFLCTGENVKVVHERTFPKFFDFPTGIPDVNIVQDPIWSTWAEYKEAVNDTRVWDFAMGVKNRGFRSSQIEIDDNWETCYGDAVFNPDRFPDPKKLVDDLHSEGFHVTVWVHPFINDDCDAFTLADTNGYFIKDSNNITQKTTWWQGSKAGLIDFTNPSAVSWWVQRLKTLQKSTGIDSFKFDAGETSYMPKVITLQEDPKLWPNIFSQKYVDAISEFGGRIETRIGRGTQKHPMFVRMLDKDSVWDENNGLRTLVPSLLHFGLLGYPFVLPDMIGGNSYTGAPNEELFLRWAQANTFMPAMQFSILPWHYGEKMTERCQKVASLHADFAPLITNLGREAVETGVPIMRPTWWLCPEDNQCLNADQQFLLGDGVLVVPIVQEGALTLEVIVPPGTWKRADTGLFYTGLSTVTLKDIKLDTIVYFTKENEKEL